MKMVTRNMWGARPPRSRTPLPAKDISVVVFHYSAANADEQASHANCAARVRGIQRYHMDTQGWQDIAYSFLVCKHGYVFEGRGYSTRTAATGPANGYSLAVCFLGDDTAGKDDVTAVGRQALADITKAIQARLGKKLAYRGHRDYMSTACPGNEIYGLVRGQAFSMVVNPPAAAKGYRVVFRRKDGSVFRSSKTRWPRTAIVATDLVKNKVTRIDMPDNA